MLSSNIRTLRKLNNLTQEQLAGAIGASRQAVADWEADQTIPSAKELRALSRLFRVSLDELVRGGASAPVSTGSECPHAAMAAGALPLLHRK